MPKTYSIVIAGVIPPQDVPVIEEITRTLVIINRIHALFKTEQK